MNRATKAALINFQAYPFQLKASFFHSSPILERKRRTFWDSGGGGASRGSSRRFNQSSKRYRRLNSKQEMLRNVSAYADHLFKSWQFDCDEYDSSAGRSSSWFGQDFPGNGFRGAKSRNRRTNFWNRRGFQFLEDDDEYDVETIFSSAFGGSRSFFYSFINDEPEWQNSSRHSNNYRFYWNQRNQYDEEYGSSNDSDSSVTDVRSDRLALGLSASGPLSLEDVKNAYRACALKWHPDRHQGSSKVVAEEEFKVCSAAYQSLCDKLTLS